MCKITINVDDREKEEVQKILSEAGISMSGAVRMYFDAIRKEGDIPKSIDPFYDPENLKRIRKSADEMERGLGKVHQLIQA